MEAIICQSIQDQRELLIEVFSRRYERVAILALPKTALLAAPRPEWSVGDPSGALTGEFGMTPLSRTRVSTVQPAGGEGGNPFADL